MSAVDAGPSMQDAGARRDEGVIDLPDTGAADMGKEPVDMMTDAGLPVSTDMDTEDMGQGDDQGVDSVDMAPPVPPAGCAKRVAVTIEEAQIDCAEAHIYCVDVSGQREFTTIQSAVDAAQGDGAAGRVVAVFGAPEGDSPWEYDGFMVDGDGSGQGGGTGDALGERFVVKAVGEVVLKVRAPGSIDAPILVADVDYVTIDGFEVDRTGTSGAVTRNHDHVGIRVTDTNWSGSRISRGIHLYDVHVTGGSPANVYVANVSDVVIEGSRFDQAIFSDQYPLRGGNHIYLANEPVDRATLRCNRFEGAEGMTVHNNGDGGLIEGSLYEYNIFKRSQSHALHFQDARDMTIRYNVFADVGRSGVTAWGSASERSPRGFVIHNNLFYDTTQTQSSPSPVQIGTSGLPEQQGEHVIFNNLFVGNGQGDDITVRGNGSATIESNATQTGAAVTTQNQGSQSVPRDIFVDYDGDDLRFARPEHTQAVQSAGATTASSPTGKIIPLPEADIAGESIPNDMASIGPYQY